MTRKTLGGLVMMLVGGLWALGLTGCLFGEDGGGVVQSQASLRSIEGCGQLEDELRARTLAEMNARLDENLASALQQGSWGCWLEDTDYGQPSAGGGDTGGARESSGTNNQVAGVDEADFVKNDGRYVYILADGRFQIVEAWPAAQSRRIAAFPIEGTPRKLFVHADRALIYSSLTGTTSGESPSPWGPEPSGQDECTYGYGCELSGDGRPLKITVLDITDRTHPVLVRETTFSGSLLAARRIDEAVHTVVTFPARQVPGVQSWPDAFSWCNGEAYSEAELLAMFAALRAQNTAAIEDASLIDWIPGARDTLYQGDVAHVREGLLTGCQNFYASSEGEGSAFLSVVSMDPSRHDPLTATTVVGRAGFVYASAASLYVATRQRYAGQDWWYDDAPAAGAEASTVHAFSLAAKPYPRSAYVASGVVKGRVLNQFAMDEHAGRLRIATTSGHLPSPDVHSTITILEPRQGVLVETGRIDHLAPTEDIRSVRFDGPRGFVVTFKKTDPLFVLDLASPTAPRVAGELKIPGFSTYMHVMDEDHVLSIGYDADDQGSFAWFTGILLQIFDISDPAAPTLKHREVIGSRGSTSEAATNHLAFNYFASQGLLALPMTVCEGGSGGGSYGDLMTFSGLMVYRVGTSAGFDYLGGVEHQTPETQESYWGACSNWWTDSNSIVQRSIFMDDFVYSITPEEIRVDAVSALGTDVAVVDLTAP